MTITLYKVTDDRRKVNKFLGSGITKSLALKGDVDMMAPEWVIKGDGDFYNKYNYCYCPDLGRYYYIHKEYRTGGLLVLKGEEDVLMTYAPQIRGLLCMVERQENIYNPYFDDNLYPVATGGYIKAIDVGAVTSTANVLYLTCVGGVSS